MRLYVAAVCVIIIHVCLYFVNKFLLPVWLAIRYHHRPGCGGGGNVLAWHRLGEWPERGGCVCTAEMFSLGDKHAFFMILAPCQSVRSKTVRSCCSAG